MAAGAGEAGTAAGVGEADMAVIRMGTAGSALASALGTLTPIRDTGTPITVTAIPITGTAIRLTPTRLTPTRLTPTPMPMGTRRLTVIRTSIRPLTAILLSIMAIRTAR